MTQFKLLILSILLSLNVLGAGTYIKGPALIEGFTTTASSAGTLTLTVSSETKQIITGATTHTVVAPDATTLPLGRKFLIINKSSGNVTVNDGSGALLVTVAGGTQAEIHLRAAGSAAGTWDVLESSAGGGGGTWGSITGFLSDQTDLQSALNAKADENNPGFAGTIGTTITASRLLVTDASSNLAASATTATEAGYLSGVTGGIQTQLNAKQARSTLTTAGDIYVATASATTTRLGVTALDGRQLVTDSAATNKIRYKAPLVDNFIKNGDAESVTPIVTYADAAGTRPVDGTGGSPNVTTAISSSSPMFDVNSFTLVKDAANRQGQGWAIPFTIPAGQQAKVLQIEVPYIVSSGTFVAGSQSADSDVIWYIYDVTNSALIEPSSIKMLSNSTTISDRFIANFQTSATGTSYRLIAHVATTSASAYTLKIDDIQVKPSQYVYGTPITDWVAWTPTGSWSTNTTYTGLKRRVGSDGEYRVKIALAGAPTSASLTVNLPSGEVIDTTKLVDTTAGNDFSFGQANMLDSGVANYIGGISYSSTTAVQLNATATGSTYLTNSGAITQAVQATWGASDLLTMFFKVPIAGWSSATQMSDSYDGRQIGFRANNSATSINSTPAKIVWTNTDKDDVAGHSSGTYTVRSSGWYDVTASLYISGTPSVDQTSQVYIYRNGAAIKTYTHRYKVVSATTTSIGPVTDAFYFNAGDTIEIYGSSEITSAAISSSTTLNTVFIGKRQAPTTISATERVSAVISLPSGQALGNATTDTVVYTSKEEDTHGAYNTSTGEYTCPYSGRYDISVLQTCSVRSSATFDLTAYVFVNGVEKASLNNYSGVNTVLHMYPVNLTTSVICNAGDIITIRSRAGYSGESLVANSAKNRASILRVK